MVGGAAWGDIPTLTEMFFDNLPRDTLEEMHLSGLPCLKQIGKAICSQKSSLKKVKVDYLCANHGTNVDEQVLPEIPNIEELILDVADLSEMHAGVFLNFLKKIKTPKNLRKIYLPHMVVLGQIDELRDVVNEIKTIGVHRQLVELVLRFHALTLPLSEFYDIRESLDFLPACCLSRTFLVALDRWASWWPPIGDVWKQNSQLTGRAMFKEQIDFGSLGACSDREWLRLSKQRKLFWSNNILPGITKFWNTQQVEHSKNQPRHLLL